MIFSDDSYQRIIATWSLFYPQQPNPSDLATFLEQSKILDQAHQSNLRTIIFGYSDFNIYHINAGAARFFNATPQEVMDSGTSWLLNCIDIKQRARALQNIPFVAQQMVTATPENLRTASSCYMNYKITCPVGNKHRSLFQIFTVSVSEQGQPLIGMCLIHDVAPFMDEDTWWCRYKIGDQAISYSSETDAIGMSDILTLRELEILKGLEKGSSTKDLAAELFLSNNTVDNHRRNMLKKTGANDTSALIHLAKLCQMI